MLSVPSIASMFGKSRRIHLSASASEVIGRFSFKTVVVTTCFTAMAILSLLFVVALPVPRHNGRWLVARHFHLQEFVRRSNGVGRNRWFCYAPFAEKSPACARGSTDGCQSPPI